VRSCDNCPRRVCDGHAAAHWEARGVEVKPWEVDRDVNAAWNMCWVASAWLGGQPRPYYLARPQTKRMWPAGVQQRLGVD
jgi:hypothetical protein